MATAAGRHRAVPSASAKDAGDVWEDIKQDAAVGLIGLLLGLLVTLVVSTLWLVSPFAAVPAGLLAVAGLVVLVHRMRRPTHD